MRRNLFLVGLKETLVTLAVGKTRDQAKRQRAAREWNSRGVVFHSWSHFYAARLADCVDLGKVQLATGHKSAVMAEHYAQHALDADFGAVGAAVAESFGTILSFPKAAGSDR